MTLELKLLLKNKLRDYRTKKALTFLKSDNIRSSKNLNSKKKILIATSLSGHLPCVTFESFLGIALREKNVECDYFLADNALSACMMCELRQNKNLEEFVREGHSKNRCGSTNDTMSRYLSNLDMQVHQFKKFLTKEDISFSRELSLKTPNNKIKNFKFNGIKLGEHAWSGTLRFFAKGTIILNSLTEKVLRKFFESAIITMIATQKLLEKHKYDCIVLHHGIYVPQGIIVDVAKNNNIHVVTWHTAYRKSCFIFSHDKTYHYTMLEESTSVWEDIILNKKKENTIKNYLKSRWEGKKDWINFQSAEIFDRNSIEKITGIDFNKPTVGMLTNVAWDAQLHFKNKAYDTMFDWVIQTIDFFKKNKHIQLLIRIHPAEITGTVPSNDSVIDQINNHFLKIPDNVFIIGPESKISTHSAMSYCNSVIIYGTKTGIELSSLSIPIIIAGEAWIKGKGIGFDANSKEEYTKILNMLPFRRKLSIKKTERSLKYAYHFFFRRMIPLNFIKEQRGWPPFKIDIQNLQNDIMLDNGLKTIINGIIKSKPFIYNLKNE